MTASSPSDLAVAFRSLARRAAAVASRAEGHPAAQAAVADLGARLSIVVSRVADLLGVTVGGDLHDRGEAVARTIEAVPADQWDEAHLDELRAAALVAGRHLRDADEAVDEVLGR